MTENLPDIDYLEWFFDTHPHQPVFTKPKPKLLLDIDGVICLDVSNSEARKRRLVRTHVNDPLAGRTTIFYDPAVVDRINHLIDAGFEPMWCTNWGQAANELLSPTLGFDPWPVLPTLDYSESKAFAILAALNATDPIVWVDDEISQTDLSILESRRLAERMLNIIADPTTGLDESVLQIIIAWAMGANILPETSPLRKENREPPNRS